MSAVGYTAPEETTGFGYLATSPEYAFPYCGTIKRWDAKFMNKGTLWLQVWRHHKVMNYRLVQETPVYVTKVPTLEQMTSITTQDIIHFDKGDVIGWKSEANEIIPFRSSPVIVGGRGFWRLGSVPDPGGLVDWGQGEFVYGRQYAVSAIIAHNSCPYFVRDGQMVTSYTVVIDDAADLFTPVITVSVKDNDDNSTLRVSMETESIYFKFNDTSYKVYTVNWLRVGHYSLLIEATDPCGQSALAQVFITVVDKNPTTTQEMFLGKPAIVWRVGLPLSLGLSVICLGSISLYACIQWKRGPNFPDSLNL